MKPIKAIKYAIAYTIVLLPAVLVACVFLDIAMNAARINGGVDAGALRERAEEYLASERRSAAACLADGKMTIEYAHVFPRSRYGSFKRTIHFVPASGEKLIYVYGSSPVVSKPPFAGGLFGTFPELMERCPGAGQFKVYNMAMTSADSLAILEIVRATARVKKPDIAIYYYEGGMDYESAYYAAGIKESFYPLTVISLKDLLDRTGLARNRHIARWAEYLSWFNRSYIQTSILNLLQAAGLIKIDPGPFDDINNMIERDFEKNLAGTAELLEKMDIPVVFVVNPDNLAAKPCGVYSVTQQYYDRAMGTHDRRGRIALLKAARDSELFTGDLRGKSGTRGVIRGLGSKSAEGVFVFDLESELEAEGYPLDGSSFYDYAHMKPCMHRKVADEICRYLYSKGLIPGEVSKK